jgi:hypothetical protein
MQLKSEIRERLKVELTEWLSSRVWIEDEIYPFNDLNVISREFSERVRPFGIQLEGTETFGETITFNSRWEGEDVWFQTNINPTIQRDGFRVVFRWKGLPTKPDTHSTNTEN